MANDAGRRRGSATTAATGTWRSDGGFSQSYLPAGPAPASTPRLHRLLIDNRDRRDAANTSPFDFTVSLTAAGVPRFENVVGVELKAAAVPKVSGEAWVALRIDQLDSCSRDLLRATASAADGAFAVVYFDGDQLLPGQVKPTRMFDFFQKDAVFQPALATLDRLDVRFLKHDGSTMSATDTAGNTTASIFLEVTTLPAMRG